MLEKILLLSLISLFYADIETLKVNYLKTNDIIEISDQKNFLVCVQIYEDLTKGDNFYLIISSEEKGDSMNKNLFYNFSSNSCQNPESLNINISNPGLKNSKSDVKLEDTSKGFSYEYEIEKKEENDKYMLLFINYYRGKKMKIQYSPYSAESIIIAIVVSVVVIIVVIIIVIVIICLCIRKKKVQEVQMQYQSSFVNNNSSDPNDALVPNETIET